jgi:hypothetical protein
MIDVESPFGFRGDLWTGGTPPALHQEHGVEVVLREVKRSPQVYVVYTSAAIRLKTTPCGLAATEIV